MTSTISLAERICSSVAGEKNPAMRRNKPLFQHSVSSTLPDGLWQTVFSPLNSLLLGRGRGDQQKPGIILDGAAEKGGLEHHLLHVGKFREESAAVHVHLKG